MPMGSPRKRRPAEKQLLLPFDEPRDLPRWKTLPGRARRDVVELLAAILRAQLDARPAHGRQVDDE